ncbi:hypothetical protein IE53DRAFT_163613 [Violaceomyces palustris]|uniref:Uncharacterized protein n=1 Tax=Violaceomyces palustris TaxID=1673888 RepID=A0ACD0NTF0_9BASI|nr:hypothetical protein IE53DRAFT_163613 [Violaceomyces palustris]
MRKEKSNRTNEQVNPPPIDDRYLLHTVSVPCVDGVERRIRRQTASRTSIVGNLSPSLSPSSLPSRGNSLCPRPIARWPYQLVSSNATPPLLSPTLFQTFLLSSSSTLILGKWNLNPHPTRRKENRSAVQSIIHPKKGKKRRGRRVTEGKGDWRRGESERVWK